MNHIKRALIGLYAAMIAGTLQADIDPAETCAGKREGSACWLELASQPNCHIWSHNYSPSKSATWTGTCRAGIATGTGTLTWSDYNATLSYEGQLTAGKMQSPFRTTRSDGTVETIIEGDISAGIINGWGTMKSPSGGVSTGFIKDNKLHGLWTHKEPDGNVLETPYVEGKIHGTQINRYADGTSETPYVEGREHGTAVTRFTNGTVIETRWVSGKKHGSQIQRLSTGGMKETPYVDGKRHGIEIFRHSNGIVEITPWVDDKLHGTQIIRLADGTLSKIQWVNDEVQDIAVQ